MASSVRRDGPQGAFPGAEGTTFRVWAPHTDRLELVVEGRPPIALERDAEGVFAGFVEGIRAGDRYQYRFPDGRLRPDPASRLLEHGVHGASTVVDPAFDWTDAGWRGVPLESLSIYELHIGTYTPEGTLDALIPHLPELAALGVTALELMPVAAFDGPHGWGYDGVQLYAVHAPYGGPAALQRFVDACHRHGLAVILDVVYNHLGPSGNYLREFGPYFTDRHTTPWGEAINYDGERSRHVRDYAIENALMWIRDFHIDGLRLDAVQNIYDDSDPHLLKELNAKVQALAKELGREVHLIAESDLNDPKLLRTVEEGGYGLASQWTDDFHHSLHTTLTSERTGYYADFRGLPDLARVYRQAFVYTGQHSAYRGRPHGSSARGLPGRRFNVAAQNHDQVGNRAQGDRLTATLSHEALRFAAAATILSPFLPLLFMGEEYAETAPFQYFTSFPDAELGRAVSEGRRREFAAFVWQGEVPDPQSPSTFERSRLDHALKQQPSHARMLQWYRALLELRRTHPSLRDDSLGDEKVSLDEQARVLTLSRFGEERETLLVLHADSEPTHWTLPRGVWRTLVDSWDERFSGETGRALPGAPTGEVTLGPWHALLLERAG